MAALLVWGGGTAAAQRRATSDAPVSEADELPSSPDAASALARPEASPGHAYPRREPPDPEGDLLLRSLGASWAGAGIGAALGAAFGTIVGAFGCIDSEASVCVPGVAAGMAIGAATGLLVGAVTGVTRSFERDASEGLGLFGLTLVVAGGVAAALLGVYAATNEGASLAAGIAVPLVLVPFAAPLLAAALFGESPRRATVAAVILPTAGGATVGASGVF